MLNIERRLLAPLSTILALTGIPGAVHAAQPGSATDFNGSYAVHCEKASLVLGLQQFQVVTGDGSSVLGTPINHSVTIDLQCAPDTLEAEAIAVYGRCMTGTSGLVGVDRPELCATVADAVGSVIDDVAAVVNGTFAVTVFDQGTWANRVLGIYGMDGDFTSLTGSTTDGDFLISNAGGSSNGDFLSLSALPLLFTAGDSCQSSLATVVTAVDGKIDRAQAYALDADFNVDLSLWCQLPSDAPQTDVAGRIGLSFHADLSGSRL
jgi:hypothetical protein